MKRIALAASLALAGPALAQRAPLRDPMRPPAAASPAPRASAPAPAAPLPAVRHLLVIGETRWVLDGGRRHGVGDLLGGARIERIEDSAVVVRRGGALERLPLYTGITRRPVAEPGPEAARASTDPTRIATSASTGGPRSRRSTPTP